MANAGTAAEVETWAQRYDRAAGELVGDDVVAAARFMRPRGWKAFGHALTDGPVGVVQRACGRPPQVRLPVTLLVAVTGERVHLLTTQQRPGEGPLARPTRTLAAWERDRVAVATAVEDGGTRLTIAPEGAPRVELYGPPDELTARVVEALTGERSECDRAPAAADTAAAAPELARA